MGIRNRLMLVVAYPPDPVPLQNILINMGADIAGSDFLSCVKRAARDSIAVVVKLINDSDSEDSLLLRLEEERDFDILLDMLSNHAHIKFAGEISGEDLRACLPNWMLLRVEGSREVPLLIG